MITIRLDPKLDQAVSDAARNLGLTKSDLVRQSIIEFISKNEAQDAWNAGKDLFGKYASGDGTLSSNRKKLLKEKLKAKKHGQNTC